MAPPTADVDVQESLQSRPVDEISNKVGVTKTTSNNRLDGPLKYSGSLDSYDSFDVTSVIGREFPGVQLSDILHDDEKIRDLAVLGRSTALGPAFAITNFSVW